MHLSPLCSKESDPTMFPDDSAVTSGNLPVESVAPRSSRSDRRARPRRGSVPQPPRFPSESSGPCPAGRTLPGTNLLRSVAGPRFPRTLLAHCLSRSGGGGAGGSSAACPVGKGALPALRALWRGGRPGGSCSGGLWLCCAGLPGAQRARSPAREPPAAAAPFERPASPAPGPAPD